MCFYASQGRARRYVRHGDWRHYGKYCHEINQGRRLYFSTLDHLTRFRSSFARVSVCVCGRSKAWLTSGGGEEISWLFSESSRGDSFLPAASSLVARNPRVTEGKVIMRALAAIHGRKKICFRRDLKWDTLKLCFYRDRMAGMCSSFSFSLRRPWFQWRRWRKRIACVGFVHFVILNHLLKVSRVFAPTLRRTCWL